MGDLLAEMTALRINANDFKTIAAREADLAAKTQEVNC
jgi:hypothetical protein